MSKDTEYGHGPTAPSICIIIVLLWTSLNLKQGF